MVELLAHGPAGSVVDVDIHHLRGLQRQQVGRVLPGRVPVPGVEQVAAVGTHGGAQLRRPIHGVDELVPSATAAVVRPHVLQPEADAVVGQDLRRRLQPPRVEGEVLLVAQLVRGGGDPGGRAPHAEGPGGARQGGQGLQVSLEVRLGAAEVEGEAEGGEAYPGRPGRVGGCGRAEAGGLGDAEVAALEAVGGGQPQGVLQAAGVDADGAGAQGGEHAPLPRFRRRRCCAAHPRSRR